MIYVPVNQFAAHAGSKKSTTGVITVMVALIVIPMPYDHVTCFLSKQIIYVVSPRNWGKHSDIMKSTFQSNKDMDFLR